MIENQPLDMQKTIQVKVSRCYCFLFFIFLFKFLIYIINGAFLLLFYICIAFLKRVVDMWVALLWCVVVLCGAFSAAGIKNSLPITVGELMRSEIKVKLRVFMLVN